MFLIKYDDLWVGYSHSAIKQRTVNQIVYCIFSKFGGNNPKFENVHYTIWNHVEFGSKKQGKEKKPDTNLVSLGFPD